MRDYKSLAHARWDCKYHIVFIPKKRRKIKFGTLRKHLGEIFHELAQQKGVVIEEGALNEGSRPYVFEHTSKVSSFKCSRLPERKKCNINSSNFKGKQKNFAGEAFWAKGYFVSTVGLDEEMVSEYIRNQEKNDVDRDQLKFVI
jgi:putative transposase